MRKYIAAAALLLLMAAAFFLPEALSSWNDRLLLDNVSLLVREQDQEGFAESVQLSIAEKVLLLRSGSLTATELSRETVEGVSVNISTDGSFETETSVYLSGQAQVLVSDAGTSAEKEAIYYSEATTQLWEGRLAAVRQEVRNLQALGGLPMLWSDNDELSYTGYGELLYIDPNTRMSFQVYRITLSGGPYSLELLVDHQSERILSFSLQWGWDKAPSWGMQGAVNFGGTWRSYWELDSVGSGWYDDYTKSILERVEAAYWTSGDYSAMGQIVYTYDGQSMAVPLECESFGGRACVIKWNR